MKKIIKTLAWILLLVLVTIVAIYYIDDYFGGAGAHTLNTMEFSADDFIDIIPIQKDDIQIAQELTRRLVEENIEIREELNKDLDTVVRAKKIYIEAMAIASTTQAKMNGRLDGFKVIDLRGYDLYWQIVDDRGLMFEDDSIETIDID